MLVNLGYIKNDLTEIAKSKAKVRKSLETTKNNCVKIAGTFLFQATKDTG
jgi:hypothetical protein